MKKNSGITLIALVITIVVMLILAVVAIRLTIGEDGIFKRTKQAKGEYINSQSYEKSQVNTMDEEITKHVDKDVQIKKYRIVYSANGGTETMEDSLVPEGESITLPENSFIKDKYRFIGWNTETNGSGVAYENEATINAINEDITLYAQWEKITYLFRFTNGTTNVQCSHATNTQIEPGTEITFTTSVTSTWVWYVWKPGGGTWNTSFTEVMTEPYDSRSRFYNKKAIFHMPEYDWSITIYSDNSHADMYSIQTPSDFNISFTN